MPQLSQLMTALIFGLSLLSPNTGHALSGTLTISGTGDSTNILRALGRSFEAKEPGATIIVPDSIGSNGGIKMLLKKRTDLARTARPLRQREKNLGLTEVQFALSPIVFAVHSQASQLSNISTSQLKKIYQGTLNQWRDLQVDLGAIYPITREQGDSSLRVLNKFLDISQKDHKGVAKIIYSTPKTVQTLLRYKQTIGFIPMSTALGTDLHVLAIDNIYPNFETVKSGRYRFVVPFSLVYQDIPSPLAQAFIDYLTSREGWETILNHGAIPIN